MTADPIATAELAYAASTNVEGDEAVMYVAHARMAVVHARERLDVVDRMVTAREAELVRISKLPKAAK